MTPPDFRQRSTEAELLDSRSVSTKEFQDCLETLEFINALTLAYRPTLRWLKRMLRGTASDEALSLLDIGSGGGDMLRKIWKTFGTRNHELKLFGVDLNSQAKQVAQKRTPKEFPIRYESEDIFTLADDDQADFIITSLFPHHLTDSDIIRFLQLLDRHAVRGWFINDLRRHFVPYYFIRWVAPWLFSNRIINHDAPLSVARAFTVKEWGQYLEAADIPTRHVRIERHFPFRLCVSCHKP